MTTVLVVDAILAAAASPESARKRKNELSIAGVRVIPQSAMVALGQALGDT